MTVALTPETLREYRLFAVWADVSETALMRYALEEWIEGRGRRVNSPAAGDAPPVVR